MQFYSDISKDVDTLGRLNSQIKTLEKQADEITMRLKELAKISGATVFHGNLYSAQFSVGNTGDRMLKDAAVAKFGRDFLIQQGYMRAGTPTQVLKVTPKSVEVKIAA